jgi:uncharacterized protein (DUF302 family)
MKKFLKPFIIGFLAGMIVMGICVWFLMPKMMINLYESKFEFNETVSLVEEAVKNTNDWKTPITFDIRKNIDNAGFYDMTQVKIVSLCQPEYAHQILNADKDKLVSSMMPLGIGVYESNDGKIFIAEMNIGLMGKMFGGTISEVMGKASTDIETMLDGIVIE